MHFLSTRLPLSISDRLGSSPQLFYSHPEIRPPVPVARALTAVSSLSSRPELEPSGNVSRAKL